MDFQLPGLDALLGASLIDQLFRQLFRFAFGEQPADHIATVDVQDHVQVVVAAGAGSAQFCDVPTPQLVGLGRQQFRLGIDRMTQLVAAFADFLLLVQDAIHGAPVAHIRLLVQQRGIHLARGLVLEPLAVQHHPHLLFFGGAEGTRRGRRRRGWGERYAQRWRLLGAVETAARYVQRLTGGCGPDGGGELLRELDHFHGSVSLDSSGIPSNCASFFWNAMMVSARFRRASRRSISRFRAAFSAASGSGWGPRFFGAKPSKTIRSRWWRQEVRCEEYKPSRRSRAPS